MSQRQPASSRVSRRFGRHVLPLAGVLLVFWFLLSGRTDPFHLTLGALSALCIAIATQPLLLLAPAIGNPNEHPLASHPWRRLLGYLPWLVVQIVKASLQVAYVVLHPSLPIDPEVVHFKRPLPHNLARLTLANSITLTPGTVTLDVDGDDYAVHALTRGDRVEASTPLVARVAALFEKPPQAK